MSEYVVLLIKPFANTVKVESYDSYEAAKDRASEIGIRRKYDIVIVEKDIENGKNKYQYVIKKFGYGRFYNLLNKILYFLFFLLVLTIIYLYTQYAHFK